MSFSVLILGSGSAVPLRSRNHAAQVIDIDGKLFLMDCGEGTQVQLRNNKVKFQRIDHIFISHLHGDHYLGLVGLLFTMTLLGRTKPMHLYGPDRLKDLVDIHMEVSSGGLGFELIYHATNAREPHLVYEDKKVEIIAFPLKHKILTRGFLFREKPKPRKLLKEAIELYQLPVYARKQAKEGMDYETESGEVIPNAMLTEDPPPSMAYAYCSDTAYAPKICETIGGIDLLYHEATYLAEDQERAKATKHSTAREAGMIAREAEVKKLLIGHFSNKYEDGNSLLEEARREFQETYVAEEGRRFELD